MGRRLGFFRSIALPVALIGAGLALAAQTVSQTPPQRPPTFRAGIDLSRVSVRVLDQQRRPVRGLTDKDFTVIINGVPQPIVTVITEDESGPVTPTAPWMRDISPDVATNSLENPRLFVIIMDDIAADSNDPARFKRAILIGKAILDQLAPSDLATVVFTADNRAPQDFTTDHARLAKAMERFHPTAVPGRLNNDYRRDTIRAAIAFLRERPDLRSAILWVGGFEVKADEYMLPLGIKPKPGAGLVEAETLPFPTNLPAIYTINTASVLLDARVDTIDSGLSGVTGGRTIAGTNTPETAIPSIFEELGVRYTIGYQPTEPDLDGRFRRVEVRVNRPDLIVLPPHPNYYQPKPKDLGGVTTAEQATPETTLALSGMIPLADEPLRLAVASFVPVNASGGGDSLAQVAVALGVDLPPDTGRIADSVELEMRLFDGEGRKQLDERHLTQTLRPRSGRGGSQFDVLSTLALKPGRYNIRISTHSTARDRSGSVFTDFVVPDFAKAPISLSGAIVSVAFGRSAVPAGEFLALLPLTPTTTREFATNDRVTVFLRLYAAGGKSGVSVPLRAEIRNSQDAVVWSANQSLTPAGAGPIRSADYRLQLPLERLPPDEYVLSVAGDAASRTPVRRDVRFAVR